MTFQFLGYFIVVGISVLVTFQFWWFHFWCHSVLMKFQFWNFCFGGIFIVYCLLSTVYCILSTVYDLLVTVYWLALPCSYFDCLAIPRASPVDFDTPSQGVQQTTNNNTPNTEPLQILVWLVWIAKSGDLQYFGIILWITVSFLYNSVHSSYI